MQEYRNKATNDGLDPIIEKVETEHGITSFQINSSVAKPSIQKLVGTSKTGVHYGKNTGISFMRSSREIDIGPFDYIDRFETRNRWWGLEVRFEPELDEYFGVTADKQHVMNAKRISKEEAQDIREELDSKKK